MMETLIRDAVSIFAYNKLWELMAFILKSFSHLNFDGTHWSDTVCRTDKANSVAKSSAVLQECFRKYSLSHLRGGWGLSPSQLQIQGTLVCSPARLF